jgi:hypothetical protein
LQVHEMPQFPLLDCTDQSYQINYELYELSVFYFVYLVNHVNIC